MVRNATFWDKFWRDEYGHDVIWQRPNIFLTTWIVCTVLNWFLHFSLLGWAGRIALLIWAGLELYSGVNRFRRLLGLLVFIIVIINWVW